MIQAPTSVKWPKEGVKCRWGSGGKRPTEGQGGSREKAKALFPVILERPFLSLHCLLPSTGRKGGCRRPWATRPPGAEGGCWQVQNGGFYVKAFGFICTHTPGPEHPGAPVSEVSLPDWGKAAGTQLDSCMGYHMGGPDWQKMPIFKDQEL